MLDDFSLLDLLAAQETIPVISPATLRAAFHGNFTSLKFLLDQRVRHHSTGRTGTVVDREYDEQIECYYVRLDDGESAWFYSVELESA